MAYSVFHCPSVDVAPHPSDSALLNMHHVSPSLLLYWLTLGKGPMSVISWFVSSSVFSKEKHLHTRESFICCNTLILHTSFFAGSSAGILNTLNIPDFIHGILHAQGVDLISCIIILYLLVGRSWGTGLLMYICDTHVTLTMLLPIR